MPLTFKKAALCLVFLLVLSTSAQASHDQFQSAIAALEQKFGGRIGVDALNTANNARLSYRAQERFALCSTHKLPLVAAVLAQVDAGKLTLSQLIHYNQKDILSYAPITKQHLSQGAMSVSALCAAALEYSDNTAANLLLHLIGDAAGYNQFLRALGDTTTRLDRNEPTVNTNISGDLRDTTTPAAMLNTMRHILLGSTLSTASRILITQWLIHNTTGDTKLRAGFNPLWIVGDKTGVCDNGASNDIGIAWPPGQAPILITVYYTNSPRNRMQQNAVIAEVGHLVGAIFYPVEKRLPH